MDKKNILMLNYEFPPLGGGGGVAAYQLAKGFVARGYNVDYVTTWFKGLKKFEEVDGINIYRVKVIGRKELPTATMLSLISFPFLAYRKGRQLCRKKSYEFINTHFTVPTGPLGVWLSKKFKIKNILSIHGGDIYDPSKKSSPHRKWYFRKVVNWVLNKSSFVVAQSSNTKENAEKYYNFNKEISIIPLAYEPFHFKKIDRKRMGLDDSLFYTISVGRVVKRKGYDFLIKGIAQSPANVHALILGDGPEKERLVRQAKELGIEDRVHFLGFVSDASKFQYLDNANLYLLSSMHEGFGIVLQEAMQVGLPIISTDNGGQVDFIKEGKNGYLVKFGDVDRLSRQIEKVASDKKLSKKYSEFNKKQIVNFKSDKICSLYEDVL